MDNHREFVKQKNEKYNNINSKYFISNTSPQGKAH
jgi:hypothetical protein